MDINNLQASSEKTIKKIVSFRSFLETNKSIQKSKIREYFLQNCSNIPQELRLIIWKIFLGISNSLENLSSDKILEDHYLYLKNTLTNVLEINSSKPEELNYFIYLLDKGKLPLSDYNQPEENAFYLIYRQMSEILDDQKDFESFYLTSDVYEYLSNNLTKMKEIFHANLPTDIANRHLIEQINIDLFLTSGLAGLFKDVKLYHIIWDRLVMEESELLVFTLIGLFESCKEDHLKTLVNINYSKLNLVQKFALDESKILKKTTKFYRNSHSNSTITNMIVNYFNSK